MLLHGYSKIKYGLSSIEILLVKNNLPAMLAYCVYLGEVLAPILLIIGFKTRFAAFLIFVNMIAAVYLAHSNDVINFSQSGGLVLELQFFYIFTALSLMFMGAGKFSVDRE